jgi:hypothetical protein
VHPSRQIFQETGCLSACKKSEFNIKSIEKLTPNRKVPTGELFLNFIFNKGRYEIKEQYILYDGSSFAADIGGYLGLLLGQSIMGVYRFGACIISRLWNVKATDKASKKTGK